MTTLLADHGDVLLVLGVAALMLLILLVASDRMMARRFRIHEQAEERMHAGAVLLAEGAAARALDNIRHLDELRIETNAIRLDVSNLSELVRVHESRISDAEMRLLRASMLVPRRGDP